MKKSIITTSDLYGVMKKKKKDPIITTLDLPDSAIQQGEKLEIITPGSVKEKEKNEKEK